MDTVLIFGLLAVLCAILNSVGVWKRGLLAGFAITTTLLAIHYNFGNDYATYLEWFEEDLYTNLPHSLAEFKEMGHAPGWTILNFLFGQLFGESGFFVLVAALSIFEGWAYYFFIKQYVPVQWYWFAMTIYVLNNHFFILTFSMMRQSFVMAVFLIALHYIHQKKILIPAILILLAAPIHYSVLICIPLVFIQFIPARASRAMAIICSCLLVLFLASSSLLQSITDKFNAIAIFANYMDTYSDFGEAAAFGLGYLVKLLPFGIAMIGLWNNTFDEYNDFVYIWAFSVILLPFGTLFPIFSRIIMYFELPSLCVFPLLCSSVLRSKPIKIMLILSIIILYAHALKTTFFMTDSVFYDAFQTFQTIF